MISTTTSAPDALAHFQKGEALFHNLRTDEAAKEFEAALKIDSAFPLAHAFHGLSVPGPEGLKEIDAAAAAASGLPEAERTLIEGIAAARRGDTSKSIALYTKVTELTPGDWRSHYVLGQQLLFVPKSGGSGASSEEGDRAESQCRRGAQHARLRGAESG